MGNYNNLQNLSVVPTISEQAIGKYDIERTAEDLLHKYND